MFFNSTTLVSLPPNPSCRTMKPPAAVPLLEEIARLRLLVGYLGQRKQFGWWDCTFLDPTGLQFLATTFPRTARLAGLRSITEAACRIHDQALGRGAFHLFRLPLAIEERVEDAALEWIGTIDLDTLGSTEAALGNLAKVAGNHLIAPAGPVQIDVERKILNRTSLTELAAHYTSAFSQGIRCFPYFASVAA